MEKTLLWAGVVSCIAYLLPNHYSPWLSFHQEMAAAIAFAPLLAWGIVRSSHVPAITYGAIVLAVVPILQIAAGKLYFSTDGWMSCLYLLGFALSSHAGAQCVQTVPPSPKKSDLPAVEVLWTALLVAALLSALIAFHQWLLPTHQGIFIVEMPPRSRPFGNLAQPNQLATLILLGAAGLMYLWEARRLRACYAILAIVLLLWALVMTGSRSVLLALLWLLPAYALMRKRCHLRTSPTAILLILSFYLGMTWLWPVLDEWLLLGSGVNTALERMSTPGIRQVIWVSLGDAIGRAPWFGYGWGQISVAQIAVALNHPPTHLLLESSHNLLLDLALWNGLPVAILVVIGLAFWFFHQVRSCDSPTSWATLLGVAVVFNHAMVEYPLSYAYFLLPVGFFMGFLSREKCMPLNAACRSYLTPMTRGVLFGLGVFAAGLTSSAAIEYFPMEADWSLMRFQEARIGDLEKTEPPRAILLIGLQQFLKFSRTEARSGMSEEELEWMRRVSERFAYAAPMFKYASALSLNDRPEDAAMTLKKLCFMQPKSVCESAKKHWEVLAKGKHPELGKTNFPSTEFLIEQ